MFDYIPNGDDDYSYMKRRDFSSEVKGTGISSPRSTGS